MRRFVLIAFLALTATAQEQSEEPRLRREAFEALATGHHWSGRRRVEEYLEKFPESPHAPALALAFALSHDRSPEEIGFRIEGLKRVLRDYPESKAAGYAKSHLTRANDLIVERDHKRTLIPAHAPPGTSIPVSREGGGHSAYRIHVLPPGAVVEALRGKSYEDLRKGGLDAESLREHWKLVDTAGVAFDRTEEVLKADLSEPGNYVIEEETLGHKSVHWVRVQRTAVYAKCLGGEAIVYAGDPYSGEPRGGVELSVIGKDGVREFRTDARGFCRFALTEPAILVATHGEEVDHLLLAAETNDDRSLVHVSTDRPVYRPGQTVHFKAIRRELVKRRLRSAPREDVKVEIRGPGGRILQSGTKRWSDLGTLTGSFEIGNDEPPIGPYSVLVHVPRHEDDEVWLWWDFLDTPRVWFKTFQVAAYRKPDLEVKVELPDAFGEKGKTRARVRAEYFFGGPAADAEVVWSVWRHDWGLYDQLRWMVPRPPMDDPLEWFREQYDERLGPRRFDDGVLSAEGSGRTDADGMLEFEFEADPGEGWRPSFVVHAVVIDQARRRAEADAVMQWPDASVRVTVGADRMFYEPGEAARVFVEVQDASGQLLRDREVELTAFLRNWEDDEWSEYESFFRTKLRTDEAGRASCGVPLKEGGYLRFRARTRDRAGRLAQDRADLWVFDRDGLVFDDDLGVFAERLVYRPGETMRFLVQSSEVPLTCLLTVEADAFHVARVIELKEPQKILELPALPSYAPDVVVKLVGWKDGECLSGGMEVFVCPVERLLDVKIMTDKRTYPPRAIARIDVETGFAGSEVELAIVDSSVYEVMEDDNKDLFTFFHPISRSWPMVSGTFAAFGDDWMSYRRWLMEEETEAMFAGQAEEAPGSVSMAPAATRRLFPDTLYWTGALRTGPDGKGSIEVETPDSLTHWRIVARAVGGRDRFGSGESGLLTRKRVVARLAAPRFFVEKDETTLGVVVRNGLREAQEFAVRLEADGLALEGAGEQTVTIAAGGETRLDWKVVAGAPGDARLKATALSPVESDSIEFTVPVLSRLTLVRDARSGRVEKSWSETFELPEVAEDPELRVLVTSSTGGAVREALPFLGGYPYGCVEQTMSRFLPAVVAWKASRDAGIEMQAPGAVSAGLHRLYNFQHEDGGWGWWTNDDTHAFMTTYVLFGLLSAKEAGFEVDPMTLTRGLELLEKMETTAFSAYVLSLAGKEFDAPEPESVEDRAYLVLAGRTELAAGLPTGPPAKPGPSAVRRTALVIRALSAAGRDTDALVNWLLTNRRGGAWYSTLDTAYAVLALVSLGLDREEPAAELLLNGEAVPLKEGKAVVPAPARGELVVRNTGIKPVYASAVLRYRGVPTEAKQAGFSIARAFLRKGEKGWTPIESGAEIRAGDPLRLVLNVEVRADLEFLMVDAPLPAGIEPRLPTEEELEDFEWGQLMVRDDRIQVAATELHEDRMTVAVECYAVTPGRFTALPARAFAMYDPDREARSGPFVLKIADRD